MLVKMPLKKVKNIAYNIAGFGGRGREFKVLPDDRLIVGYPKSGNTWLDFLIASMIAPKASDVTFGTINSFVPDIHSESPLSMRFVKRPRLLKSHDYYNPKYPKIVHLVRHPYSVAVSYYYYCLKNRQFDEAHRLSNFVPEWIRGEWSRDFLNWGEHTSSWLDYGDPERMIMVRYEDLVAAPKPTLCRISNFFGLVVSDERLEEAITWCIADNMAKLEKDGLHKGFKGYRKARVDIDFVRTDKSNKREGLTDSDKRRIAEAFANIMSRIGYER